MNVFLLQMKSQRFSRNDNLTVKPAQPSRPPQCWNYYRVVFKLTLSHSCFQGCAEFRVEQFSLFISIKIFSSSICQSQTANTTQLLSPLLRTLLSTLFIHSFSGKWSRLLYTESYLLIYLDIILQLARIRMRLSFSSISQPRVHQFQ